MTRSFLTKSGRETECFRKRNSVGRPKSGLLFYRQYVLLVLIHFRKYGASGIV